MTVLDSISCLCRHWEEMQMKEKVPTCQIISLSYYYRCKFSSPLTLVTLRHLQTWLMCCKRSLMIARLVSLLSFLNKFLVKTVFFNILSFPGLVRLGQERDDYQKKCQDLTGKVQQSAHSLQKVGKVHIRNFLKLSTRMTRETLKKCVHATLGIRLESEERSEDKRPGKSSCPTWPAPRTKLNSNGTKQLTKSLPALYQNRQFSFISFSGRD